LGDILSRARLLFVVILGCLLTAVSQNQPITLQGDSVSTLKVDVKLVPVHVVVRDGYGKAIGNLRKEDFTSLTATNRKQLRNSPPSTLRALSLLLHRPMVPGPRLIPHRATLPIYLMIFIWNATIFFRQLALRTVGSRRSHSKQNVQPSLRRQVKRESTSRETAQDCAKRSVILNPRYGQMFRAAPISVTTLRI
jgi:hypothetical protein